MSGVEHSHRRNTQIDPSETTGPVADFYGEFADVPGGVPDVIKVLSGRADAMRATRDLYRSVLHGESRLSRAEREMIATVVSVLNDCTYCSERHAAALLLLTGDDELVARIRDDFEQADIGERVSAMLRFATKLTRNPGSRFEEDVAGLRRLGLTNGEILDLALVVGYFNYISRIATGLGVEVPVEDTGGHPVESETEDSPARRPLPS